MESEDQQQQQQQEEKEIITDAETDKLFDFIDADKDGTVDLAEFRTFLQLKKMNPTKEQIESFLEGKGMDNDQYGFLTRSEFKELVTEFIKILPDPEQDLDAAIDVIDTNRDGQISIAELKVFMTKRGKERIDAALFDELMGDLGLGEGDDVIERGVLKGLLL